MRSRQFSSKDIADKQENKRMGTKTLASSPNNFQLKAVEAGESNTVDSSKGVAQLMYGAFGRAAGRVAASPFAKKALTGLAGVAAFNDGLGMAKDASYGAAGFAFNDPKLLAEGGINGAAGKLSRMAGPRIADKFGIGVGGMINEAAAFGITKTQGALDAQKSKDDPPSKSIDTSGKFLSGPTGDWLTKQSNRVDSVPLLGRYNPIPGVLAMNDMYGLGTGIAGRAEQVKQDHEAKGIAAAAKRAKDSADVKAKFAFDHPEQAKIADKAEADAHNPGFEKWAKMGL